MSGTGTDPAEARLAEQHLGDRLSALVDGELGHESRDRVLAHLATCCRCRAEADAQRRLKNVFAEAAPPPPSESFLARLQGLPGGDADGPGERFAFSYVPAGSGHAPEQRGFRIHHVADRPSSRGLRFAAAAAGAVSLAAVALGGVTTALPGDLAADARGGPGNGSNVAPSRSASTGTGTAAGSGTGAPETQRRRTTAPLLAQGGGAPNRTPAAQVSATAPLLPGIPAPVDARVTDTARDLAMPVMAGAAAVSPLIRPLGETTPFSLDSWPLATPSAGTTTAAAPTNSPSPSAP
ncbi:anti-sigma factor family protein [Streptomyces seoulensis]|uniref:anti-sigma factor family protein n=1 Tax=Streptomyces seoulensis TaxID=73044 RepID=UPI0033B3AD52